MSHKPTDGTGISAVGGVVPLAFISAQSLTNRNRFKRGTAVDNGSFIPVNRPFQVLVREVSVLVSVVVEVLEVKVSIEMVEIECHHCDHEWNYTGERDPGELVTCPYCYYKTTFNASTETTADTSEADT